MLRSLLVALLVVLCSSAASVSSVCNSPQVSCPAASSLAEVPNPFYSLTFDTDPSLLVGPTSYGWSANDTTESCPYTHTGVVSFDGVGSSDGFSGQSYIDLNSNNGPNSAGSYLSQYIGGYFGRSGTIEAGTSGWSFEVTVKVQSNTPWAKFYCLGAGPGNYDILTGFVQSTYEVDHTLDYTSYGSESNRVVFPASSGMPVNSWQHIVAVYQNIDQQQQAATGRVFIYVNGQLQSYPDSSPYLFDSIVPFVYRSASYLGRSCYSSDGLLDGSIDTFRIYDAALTAEQVDALYNQQMGGCEVTTFGSPLIRDASPNQVSSASVAASPIFSVTASVDPRPATGLTATTALYGWRQYDLVDTICELGFTTYYHNGHIVFPGGPPNNPTSNVSTPYTTSNFVNLSTATGPNSIGQVLPVVGGPSSGNLTDGSYGWSFELTFKPGVQAQWAKLMDLGSTRNLSDITVCYNDIVLGYYSTENILSATVCDPYGHGAGNVQLASFTPGMWYHVILVFQRWSSDAALSNWQLYQNGVLVNSVSGTYYPQAAVRQNANLGLSGWDDPQWSGLLDTFSVYDVALSQAQVEQRYEAAMDGNGECYPRSIAYIPSDAVFFDADFATDPRTSADATYLWLPSDPTDSAVDQQYHQGIIRLNGTNPVDQYIDLNLASGAASLITQPIQQQFGGLGMGSALDNSMGWSFEAVFKSAAVSTWGKLFDFSNNPGESATVGGSWDVQLGWYGPDQDYTVNLYYDVSQQNGNSDATNVVPLDTWTHFVWVIQYDAYSTQYYQPGYAYATHTTYINGFEVEVRYLQHYIEHVQRQYGFLGRSSYNDSAWLGDIDTFRIYSVALSAQQVVTLYDASVGRSSSSSSSSTGASSTVSPPSSSSSTSSSSSSPSVCSIIASEPNLLSNGGFEDGTAGYTIVGSAATGTVDYAPSAHCGSFYLYMGSQNVDATVSQSVQVSPNSTYLFSFWLYSDGGFTNDFSATASFYVDGTLFSTALVYSAFDLPATGGAYVQHYAHLSSPLVDVGQSVTLTLTIAARDDPGYLRLDDLVLIEVNGTATEPPSQSSSSSTGFSSFTSSSSLSLPVVPGQLLFAFGDPTRADFGPYDVTLDSAGNIYVASTRDDSITVLSGIHSANPGAELYHFSLVETIPFGVAVDAAGVMYVVDGASNRVLVLAAIDSSQPGSQLHSFQVSSPSFQQPRTVALDAAGNIYVGDTNNNRLVVLAGLSSATPGAQLFAFNGSASDPMQQPYGVAVDRSGLIYVVHFDAVYNDAHITVLSSIDSATPGAVLDSLYLPGRNFAYVKGLAVDRHGSIYVSDYSRYGSVDNSVLMLAGLNDPCEAAGTQLFSVGADFTAPNGVALDADGNIYVADSANSRADNRVVVLAPAQQPTCPSSSSSSSSTGSSASSSSSSSSPSVCSTIAMAPNLLYNGGFEQLSNGYNISGGLYTAVYFDADYAHCGSYYIGLAEDIGVDGTVNTSVLVSPNSTYLFSFWLGGNGVLPNDLNATVSFSRNNSLYSTSVVRTAITASTEYVQCFAYLTSPPLDEQSYVTLKLTIAADYTPYFMRLDDLDLVQVNGTEVVPPTQPSSSSSTGASSSSSSLSSPPPSSNATAFVFSYIETLYNSVGGVQFVFSLTLTAVPVSDAGSYLVTAASGRITRYDSTIVAYMVGVVAVNGYDGNDNLLFPYSQPEVSPSGISVVDDGGVRYKLFYQTAGSGYTILVSSSDPLGLYRAGNLSPPAVSLQCTAASPLQSECAPSTPSASSSSSSSSAAPSICSTLESQSNLLVNGGFEQGLSGYDVYGDGSGLSVENDPAGAHCGSRYLDLDSQYSDDTLSQSVQVSSNSTYLFSFWLASINSGAARLFNATAAFYVDGALYSSAVVYSEVVYLPASGQYVLYSAYVVSPVLAVEQCVTLTLSLRTDYGYVSIDDLDLVQFNGTLVVPPTQWSSSSSSIPLPTTSSTLPPTIASTGSSSSALGSSSSSSPSVCSTIASEPNLLVNPGFELGTAGYTFSGAFTGVIDDPFYAHCGSDSVYLGSQSLYGVLSQTVSVSSNVSYLFTFWLESDGGTPNAFVATVSFYVDDQLSSSTTAYAVVDLPSSGYVQHYAELSSPVVEAGQEVTVKLTISAYDNPGYLRLDDLSLAPVNGSLLEPPQSSSSSSSSTGSASSASSSSSSSTASLSSSSESSSGSSAPPSCSVIESEPNLLSNGGFEYGTANYTIDSGSPTVVDSPGLAHCGSNYLTDSSTDVYTVLAQSVSLVPNTTYLFSFWLAVDGGRPNQVTVYASLYNPQSFYYEVPVYPSANYADMGRYLQYSAELVTSDVDASFTEVVAFTVSISPVVSPSRVRLDDLVLAPLVLEPSSSSSSSSSSSANPPTVASTGSSSSAGSTSESSSSTASSSVLGDPQFIGLRGQSYQVHGIDGEVYALISEPVFQLNARFRFLTGPRPCPVMPSTGQPSTACWSHPGSYLTELGALVQATGERVRAVAGNASVGFVSVEVEGMQLAVGESTQTGTVHVLSSHELVLTAGSFRVEMESVDGFVNLRSVQLTVPFSELRSHGLLGQTWSSRKHQSTLKVVEGEVDDYVLTEGDVMGTDFVYNRYGVQAEQ